MLAGSGDYALCSFCAEYSNGANTPPPEQGHTGAAGSSGQEAQVRDSNSQQIAPSSRLLKKLVVRSNFSMFAMAANGEMGGDPRCMCGIRYIVASYSTLRTDSSRCGQNLRDANEIVGGGGKDKKPRDQLPSAMTGLTQTADGLHPAERFLDPLALLHADV